jgi:hypothetical protein
MPYTLNDTEISLLIGYLSPSLDLPLDLDHQQNSEMEENAITFFKNALGKFLTGSAVWYLISSYFFKN